MALIKCPECGKEISSQVSTCPSCGYRLKKSKVPVIIAGLTLIVGVALAGWLICANNQNRELYQAQAQSVIDMISKIDGEPLSNISEILEAKSQYDSLSANAQKFVSNYDVLSEAYSSLMDVNIKLDAINYRKYLDVSVQITDFKCSTDGFYTKAYCDYTISVKPKVNLVFNDTVITGYVAFTGDNEILPWEDKTFEIWVDASGNGEKSGTAIRQTVLSEKRPNLTMKGYELKSISGYVTVK